ncbi:MAG: 50S ribosomal protein L25 [bacterium]|nr:50S ribosomal protein L25 [bacterium]
MAVMELAVVSRITKGKGGARQVRFTGKVPGIVYIKGKDGIPFAVDANKLRLTLIKQPTMLQLTGEGLQGMMCVVREIQRHPLTGAIEHIDLQSVSAEQRIRMTFNIYLKGTPIGIKEGGILDQIEHRNALDLKPADAPDRIEIDVTELHMNESMHIRDIKLPVGVKLLSDPDTTILTIQPPKMTGDEKPSTEPAAAPEVITARKKDEAK